MNVREKRNNNNNKQINYDKGIKYEEQLEESEILIITKLKEEISYSNNTDNKKKIHTTTTSNE